MSNENRQPSGVPVGGQFAQAARSEPEVSLDESDAPEDPGAAQVKRFTAWMRFMSPDQVGQLAYTWRPEDSRRASPTPWQEQADASRAGGRAWDAAWAAWESNPNITKRMVSNAGYAMRDAATALALRPLLATTTEGDGQHWFTQADYDQMTRSVRTVLGQIHPDDNPLVIADADSPF